MTVRHQAEADAADIRTDAVQDAREIRRQAEADAAGQQDRAKRVLTTAQDQADAIVAEAENQARAIVLTATETTEEHIDQVTKRARRHIEDVLRAERDVISRLRSAQVDVARAIEAVARSEHRPVVDIDGAAATVQFGHGRDVSDGATPAITAGVNAASVAGADATVGADLAARDPLIGMVRQAVDRAASAAVTDGTAHDTDEPGPDRDTPTPDASSAPDRARRRGAPTADGSRTEHADRPALAGSQPPSLH